MNRENVIIYLNSTGDEMMDQKAIAIIEDYCNSKGYKIIKVAGEDTELGGISFLMKYAFVGLAAEGEINKVVTIGRYMIGDTNQVLEFIGMLEDYNAYVETVADDMADMYDLLFSNSSHDNGIEIEVDEFLKSIALLFDID